MECCAPPHPPCFPGGSAPPDPPKGAPRPWLQRLVALSRPSHLSGGSCAAWGRTFYRNVTFFERSHLSWATSLRASAYFRFFFQFCPPWAGLDVYKATRVEGDLNPPHLSLSAGLGHRIRVRFRVGIVENARDVSDESDALGLGLGMV